MKKQPRKKSTSSLSLAELKKEWYEKLKKEGFEDIEVDEHRLKTWSTGNGSPYAESYKYKPLGFAAKADYYSLATHFLNENEFKTRYEEIIWTYHTEGISVRDTCKLLKKAGFERSWSIDKNSVHRVVLALRQQMFKLYNVHSGKINEQ